MSKNDSPKTRYTGPKPWLDKDWLYNEYVVKDRSTKDIANEYGCKRNTIQVWLIKHGIKKEIKTRDIVRDRPYQSYEYLYKEHIVKRKPMAQIAKECGVSEDTIRYNCDRVGIDHWRARPPVNAALYKEDIIKAYLEKQESIRSISIRYKCADKTIKAILEEEGIEIRYGHDYPNGKIRQDIDPRLKDPDWLEGAYMGLRLQLKEIAAILNTSTKTVKRALVEYGIINDESALLRRIGIRAKTFEDISYAEAYAILIRMARSYSMSHQSPKVLRRDKFTCQMCGATSGLEVHHKILFSTIINNIIDSHPELNICKQGHLSQMYKYIINDERFLDEDNLITLCFGCHIIAARSKVENEE